MSLALDQAVYNRLTGIETLANTVQYPAAATLQAAYLALMGIDPETTLASVHKGKQQQIAAYPGIAFMSASGGSDDRFLTHTGSVFSPFIDLQVWTVQDDGTGAQIMEYVVKLLNQGAQAAPLLTISPGHLWDLKASTDILEDFDQQVNLWFCYQRFMALEAR